MRGQLLSRSKGSWTIILYAGRDPETGKKRFRQHTIRGSKVEAERERVRLLRALDTGTYAEPSRQTTGEYLRGWLAYRARPNVAASTFDRYEAIVRCQLIPALGHIRLTRLQASDVRAHYAQAVEAGRVDGKGGLSPTTVLQHHRVLREALKHAVEDGLIAINPTDRVRGPQKRRREMPVLNQKETTRLLELADGTSLYVPIVLGASAGLRRGEVLGLRWRDVDLDAGTLAVTQSLETTSQGLQFKAPKTAKSRRLVPLPAFATAALREHRTHQAEARLRLGAAYNATDLVCSRADGGPWSPDSFSPRFAAFLARTDLPRIRFHDLRHSHATLLLKHGVHPKIVSERLGHSTVGLTLDTYSHVLPGLQAEAIAFVDEALGQYGHRNRG